MTDLSFGRPRPRRRWLWAGSIVLALVLLCISIYAFGLHGEISDEADRLVEVLALKPGMTIAEIGAGDGEMTVALATRLGPSGRVFSTELDANRLADIREAVAAATLTNVTVIEAAERQTNLPHKCCDVIVMRAVYHHFTDPTSINGSLARSLRPDGRLVIMDFEPSWLTRWWGRAGDQGRRSGHGVEPDEVRRELKAAGFEPVQTVDDWNRQLYCIVFRLNPAP